MAEAPEPTRTPEPARAPEPTRTPATTRAPATTERTGIGRGPGRLLLSLYGVFTVAALSRSIVQISMQFDEAPLAYLLSLVAGVIYAVITAALWRGGEAARRVALVSCTVELVGVLVVGTLTIVDSSSFPDATVWSDYGIGYLFLPLIVPVSGLLWLRRSPAGVRQRAQQSAG
jgi:hypothetical protein